nr:5'-methylthioadenosine/S-adenosylhomocysteine nucleosidase [Hydrogenophaga electricum]
MPAKAATAAARLDNTPRVAVLSAFAPELTLLRRQLADPVTHQVQGVEFTTGVLAGRPVVLFLSGISMVNAAMNTQRVLDRFNVQALVFSGIAGGVNPGLHIGDVSVPQQWGQYLEVLIARETAPGRYTAPPFMKDAMHPNYGMFFPRTVEVVTVQQPQVHRKFWFEVDPGMLAAARQLKVPLSACTAPGKCLSNPPKLVVGGNGVSGQAFMDNAAFREYTFKTFEANVLDMETAAVGQVAYSNGVPYIAFRSLSDLAGGGDGENEMGTFFGLAADNSAKVLLAFLRAWQP